MRENGKSMRVHEQGRGECSLEFIVDACTSQTSKACPISGQNMWFLVPYFRVKLQRIFLFHWWLLPRLRGSRRMSAYFLQARRWVWSPMREVQTLPHFGQGKPWVGDAWEVARSLRSLPLLNYRLEGESWSVRRQCCKMLIIPVKN